MKKFLKFIKPSFSKQLQTNIGFFNKILVRCEKLDTQITQDIENKEQVVASIQNNINELNVTKQQNMNFKQKIEQLLS